jgi:hypothetical protein
MHGIVSNLEKRGLVERKNDVSHGRILCAELTSTRQEVMISAVEALIISTVSSERNMLLKKILLECFNNLNNCDMD